MEGKVNGRYKITKVKARKKSEDEEKRKGAKRDEGDRAGKRGT